MTSSSTEGTAAQAPLSISSSSGLVEVIFDDGPAEQIATTVSHIEAQLALWELSVKGIKQRAILAGEAPSPYICYELELDDNVRLRLDQIITLNQQTSVKYDSAVDVLVRRISQEQAPPISVYELELASGPMPLLPYDNLDFTFKVERIVGVDTIVCTSTDISFANHEEDWDERRVMELERLQELLKIFIDDFEEGDEEIFDTDS